MHGKRPPTVQQHARSTHGLTRFEMLPTPLRLRTICIQLLDPQNELLLYYTLALKTSLGRQDYCHQALQRQQRSKTLP